MSTMLPPLTIFLSAFLLFQVQPMIGKIVLPAYGGVAAVWTTCLLFFQIILLLGYGYAHFLISRFGERARWRIHGCLILIALLTLPLSRSGLGGADALNSPVISILSFLTGSIGLTYLVLSATAPLLQGVLAGRGEGDTVYRLYGVSNIGSFAALLSYPFLIEPQVPLSPQLHLWSVGFILFATLLLIAIWPKGAAVCPETPANVGAPPPSRTTILQWALLAGIGCIALLAETSHISQNIAAVPLLWVVPLGLYLLSFIVAFSESRWRSHPLWGWLFVGGATALVSVSHLRLELPLIWRLVGEFLLLFAACMVAHGELVRLRPAPRHLTLFYLIISAGGVIGGLFVAGVAPLLYLDYSERAFAVVAVTVIVLARQLSVYQVRALTLSILGISLAVSLLSDRSHPSLFSKRSFYGVIRVDERSAEHPEFHRYTLTHGAVVHGAQFRSAEKRHLATTYYGERSGVALVLERFRAGKPRHIGAIGLGVGTIATYGTPNDRFRFYEINPDVIAVAHSHFSFLKDSRATIELVRGDARLELQREPANHFDILVVDAFSGDAVPMHLLTREAIQLYLRHLKPDGILVFHVSNLYLDIGSAIAATIFAERLQPYVVFDSGITTAAQTHSTYLIVPRQPFHPAVLQASPSIQTIASENLRSRVMVDDFSDLFSLIRWSRKGTESSAAGGSSP